MARVGIIGDTHIPYEHEGYMEFCVKTFRRYKVNRVVHIGDLIDHHALSFHDKEPLLASGYDEYVQAKDKLREWYKAFPAVTLVTGNHDIRPARIANKFGLEANTWLRALEEVYDMPRGWEAVQECTIDGVLYHHGYTSGGVNGFRNDSIRRMCNTVSGHSHGNAGISATASEKELIWGMAVGCGIDVKKQAFAYGKHFLHKPILACGLVIEGAPYVEYMKL